MKRTGNKKKLLMVCEAFGGGVFTYVSQLCNDMVDDFDVYLAYSLRPQTPKNYKDFLDKRVHLIQINIFILQSLVAWGGWLTKEKIIRWFIHHTVMLTS